MDRILSNIRTLQTPVLLIVLLAIVSGLASLTGSDAMATTIAEMMMTIDGREQHAIGLNGTVPGPLVRLRQGQNVRLSVTSQTGELYPCSA